MKRPLRVAITGGIGSGKSTALSEFARNGAWTLSLDEIGHELLQPGAAGFRSVARAFPWAVGPDGALDRKVLGRRVFRSRPMRRRLERLLHPLILAEMERRLPEKGVAVVEVPLLYEAKAEDRFDLVLAVTTRSHHRRLKRLKGRGMAKADALAGIRSQFSEQDKERWADLVLDNTQGRASLARQVRTVSQALALIAGARRKP